jgi:replicative DNA helicase
MSEEPRSLPYKEDAEKGLLCSVILNPPLLDELGVTAEAFFLPCHRFIFDGLSAVYEDLRLIDLIPLVDHLEREGRLEEVGGREYLVDLWNFVPTAANWRYYLAQVVEMHQRRVGIRELMRLVQAHYDLRSDLHAETVEATERTLTALSTRFVRETRPFKELVLETIERLEHERLHPETIAGVRFGIPDLDRSTGGIRAGEKWMIVAPTGEGKTALLMQAALHTALSGGHVAVFNLEMDADQLIRRMLAYLARVSTERLRTPALLADLDFPKLTTAAAKLVKCNFHIEPSHQLRVSDLASRCRRLHARHPLSLIAVDYLQLMLGSEDDPNREREVAGMSRRNKQLASELGVPVLEASQLNESGKIRESRAPAQDANGILRIVNPEDENHPRSRFIVTDKQRDGGASGHRTPVEFLGEYMLFAPREPDPEPDRGAGRNGNGAHARNGHRQPAASYRGDEG